MTKEESGYNAFNLPSDVVAAAMDIYKVYKTDGLETVALRGISLNIREGEMLALIGPSGSGKSTLIGILGGMLKPTAGSVYWSDYEFDISKLNPNEVLKMRRKFAGFVFQVENLIPYLTALQNVMLSAEIASLPRARDRAKYLLERVGLGNRMRFIPGMLSSGERQRVAIASALINNPKLILADEPTGNIDLSTSEVILELFRELNQETGTAFFIVTHSQQVGSMAKRTLEIRDGMLVGSHAPTFDIKDLDKSRILALDNFGRISLPPYLLNQLNNPKKFKVKLEGKDVILTPYVEEE